MKPALIWCLFVLSATSVFAQTTASTTTTTTTKTSTKRRKTAASAPAVTANDLQELRDALTAQQQQIQQLRQELAQRDQSIQQAQQQAQQAQQQAQASQTAISDAQQKATAAESAADDQKSSFDKLNGDMEDVRTTLTNAALSQQESQNRTSALESLVGRFRFNGDVRVRGESFFQQGTADRNRARVRVRFGFDGSLNQDFLAGISVATGAIGDPTSTNETFTNFFDRKTISLDRGWITYNPLAHRWLSLTGGKFAYTWIRTPQTFDSDLNPEGFTEKASFDLHHSGMAKNVTLQAMQLLYNESSGGQDSYALGMQASTRLELGRWTATPSFSTLKWNRPDAILQASAFAVGATTTGFQPSGSPPPAPITGIPITSEGPGCAKALNAPSFPASATGCVFAPNNMTNATFVDSKGKVHFYSGFNYADFILNNTIKTKMSRLPVNLLLEFLDNLDAESHPLDSKGNVISTLGSQNKEYGFDVNVGQTKNKNDIQIGYAWLREEQDSAIASFVESDQRAQTNILQNRVYALWKLRTNTVASFTWWHGRTLNTNLENAVRATGVAVGATEPYLNRYQFDLIYTF
jgi:Putative porin